MNFGCHLLVILLQQIAREIHELHYLDALLE